MIEQSNLGASSAIAESGPPQHLVNPFGSRALNTVGKRPLFIFDNLPTAKDLDKKLEELAQIPNSGAEIIKLIDQGANPSEPGIRGRTAGHAAVKADRIENLVAMFEHRTDVFDRKPKKKSLTHPWHGEDVVELAKRVRAKDSLRYLEAQPPTQREKALARSTLGMLHTDLIRLRRGPDKTDVGNWVAKLGTSGDFFAFDRKGVDQNANFENKIHISVALEFVPLAHDLLRPLLFSLENPLPKMKVRNLSAISEQPEGSGDRRTIHFDQFTLYISIPALDKSLSPRKYRKIADFIYQIEEVLHDIPAGAENDTDIILGKHTSYRRGKGDRKNAQQDPEKQKAAMLKHPVFIELKNAWDERCSANELSNPEPAAPPKS
ncbi:MAG: hypothetical protein ABW032_09470 [Burkholderiaceae bacterium]